MRWHLHARSKSLEHTYHKRSNNHHLRPYERKRRLRNPPTNINTRPIMRRPIIHCITRLNAIIPVITLRMQTYENGHTAQHRTKKQDGAETKQFWNVLVLTGDLEECCEGDGAGEDPDAADVCSQRGVGFW